MKRRKFYGVKTYLSEEGYHFISHMFNRRKYATAWLREHRNRGEYRKYPVQPWVSMEVWKDADFAEDSYIARLYWEPMNDRRVRSRRSKKWENNPLRYQY